MDQEAGEKKEESGVRCSSNALPSLIGHHVSKVPLNWSIALFDARLKGNEDRNDRFCSRSTYVVLLDVRPTVNLNGAEWHVEPHIHNLPDRLLVK